ncbi:hypothetical protein ACOMHN_042887 [Nucella lapillus]
MMTRVLVVLCAALLTASAVDQQCVAVGERCSPSRLADRMYKCCDPNNACACVDDSANAFCILYRCKSTDPVVGK